MSALTESPTTKIPQAILDLVSQEREVAGVTIKQIDKTGSSLHLLQTEDGQEFVRNAKIPESSAAAWEFIHSYAQELFPEDLKIKLFGVWDNAQVVPIIKKNGKDRIYRSGKEVSVYSKIVGFDTLRLAELWNLDEIFPEYTVQSSFLREPRWLDCATYHFTKKIIEETKWLDPNGDLINLIEEYWEEFSQLNEQTIDRKDLLRQKDLRRKDMDNDDAYQSSTELISIGHQIANYLRDLYTNISATDENLVWKDKPADELVLFLLHLHQTSVQQMLLWWFGISHGHLHLYNTVSKTSEDKKSPLETRIIDFDNSRTSVAKLAEHDELYQAVDSQKTKALIFDESKNINLRLQLILYLPLNDWDQELADLVLSNIDKNISRQIADLISKRLSKDITDPNKYSWFAQFLLECETNAVTESYIATFNPTYNLIIKVVNENSHFIEGSNLDLLALATYFKEGMQSLNIKTLSDRSKLLILSAIYYQNVEYWSLRGMKKEELFFAFSLVNENGTAGEQAAVLVQTLLKSFYQELTNVLITEAISGEESSSKLIKDLVNWILSSDERAFQHAANTFIFRSIDSGSVSNLIKVIDFTGLEKEKAQKAYFNFRELVALYWEKNKKETDKNILSELDTKAEIAVGRLFVWQQKIRMMFSKKRN